MHEISSSFEGSWAGVQSTQSSLRASPLGFWKLLPRPSTLGFTNIVCDVFQPRISAAVLVTLSLNLFCLLVPCFASEPSCGACSKFILALLHCEVIATKIVQNVLMLQ
uniref:Uncharacterized protein n=1 Tax=Tetraselmis sp. GSL018 TaxID=582737 RepID=A0A061RPN4_9CHLO